MADFEIVPEEVLLRPPAALATPLTMTVIAFGSDLVPPSNFSYEAFVKNIRDVPHPVLTVESNFGSKYNLSQGTKYLKPNKKPKDPHRRKQGSGKCFGSGVESRIDVRGWAAQNAPEIYEVLATVPKKEPYNLRYFPKGGTLQVSGVLMPGLEDGIAAVTIWAKYLVDQGIVDTPADGVLLTNHHINMVNHRFRIRLDHHCPGQKRMILNLKNIRGFLDRAAADPALLAKDIELEVDPEIEASALTHIGVVRHLKSKGNTVSFAAYVSGTKFQIKMFQLYGKVNILGAKSFASARLVYRYIVAWFRAYWEEFVVVLPLDDDELEEMARKSKAAAERAAKKEAKLVKEAAALAETTQRGPSVTQVAKESDRAVSRVLEADPPDKAKDADGLRGAASTGPVVPEKARADSQRRLMDLLDELLE